MTTQIDFTKMVASGNDFIVVDQRQRNSIRGLRPLSVQICDRKYGAGADGLLVLEKSTRADIKMRVFNPDGSEPDMCGNGIRCVAFYSARSRGQEVTPPSAGDAAKGGTGSKIKIETRAGIIEAGLNKDKVKVKMTEPENIKLGLPLKINKRTIRVDFINTGVPHVVIFAEGLDKIDAVSIGRQIRFHKRFLPQGTNVDFVQIIDDNNIKIRTYERGVEDETLACGTGTVAAALIYAIRNRQYAIRKVMVQTKSGEILRVEFNRINGKFKDVWLEGKASIVYKGIYRI